MLKSHRQRLEQVIPRNIILDLPPSLYKKYQQTTGNHKIKSLATSELLLHFVSQNIDRVDKNISHPFQNFELLDILYGIGFHKNVNQNNTYNISVENYLLANIMQLVSGLAIPQYRKYELSQQLRYQVDEVFYNKSPKGVFGLHYFENYEQQLLFDDIYMYIKYHRHSKYYRDDEITKYAYLFFTQTPSMAHVLDAIRKVHYTERTSINQLLFYLLYLTISEGLELYIIYDHHELINCFKICDHKSYQTYLSKGCSIICIYDTLVQVCKNILPGHKLHLSQKKIWDEVINDILEVASKGTTFKYEVSGNQGLPTFGTSHFIHTNLKKYNELKKYVGPFGGVMPMLGSNEKKILEGKKKHNYKKARNNNKDV